MHLHTRSIERLYDEQASKVLRHRQVCIVSDCKGFASSVGQAYELTAIYYQQPGEFTTRMQVNSLDAPPPSQDKNWEMWVELFSEEYHSGPVRYSSNTLIMEVHTLAHMRARLWVCYMYGST